MTYPCSHDESDDDFQLIMPTLEDEKNTDYFAQSGLVIMRALAMEGAKASLTLAFPISSKVGQTIYKSITGSDLFDSAMLHVLDTLGDTNTEAGRKALRDAAAESTTDGKNMHRNRAATLLQTAYESYLTAGSARAATLGHRVFGTGTVEIANLYRKAGEVAMTVALVNKSLKLSIAAKTWADNANTQHEKYYEISFENATSGFGLDSDGARLEIESLERTEFWDGSRTGEEWATDLTRLGIGFVISATQKGRPNPLLRFETKAARAAKAREQYHQRRAAASTIVQLDSQKRLFAELRCKVTSQD